MLSDPSNPRAAQRNRWLLRLAVAIIPVGFGLVSIVLGQDTCWDLRNYHLYNPYAWLNHRIGTDLAPAQLQSYFNPLIDVPYYWLTFNAPPRVTGFVLGYAHGINFVLLLAIARTLLANDIERSRMALALALVGCTGAAFLSEIGNTMGDNLSALFVLGSFLIVVRTFAAGETARRPFLRLLLGGLIMGLGTGLKLTNAAYALGLGIAIPLTSAASGTSRQALRDAITFGVAVVLGMAGSVGFWWVELWEVFRNPVFPQFNVVFRSPFALSMSVAEARWFPQNVLEAAVWPLVFSVNPSRVSEIRNVQIVWPILYLLFVAWGVMTVARRVRPVHASALPPAAALSPAARLLVMFVGVSFVLWMNIFGGYRYLVPIELLAPIAVWLLCLRLLPTSWGRVAARFSLAIVAAIGLLGWSTWGHSEWDEVSFRVDSPPFDDPARTTIVKFGTEPFGWVVPFFPAELAFVSLNTNFPQSSAYVDRVRATMIDRGGKTYALVAAPPPQRIEQVARVNKTIRGLGLSASGPVCGVARWAAERFRARVRVLASNTNGLTTPCELVLAPDQVIDQAARWDAAVDEAAAALPRYGIRLTKGTCSFYRAFIGTSLNAYELCEVEVLNPFPQQ